MRKAKYSIKPLIQITGIDWLGRILKQSIPVI